MNRLFVVQGLAMLLPYSAGLHAQALSNADRAEIAQFREAQAKLLSGPQSALGMVSLEKFHDGDTTVGSASSSAIRIDHLSPTIGIVRLHGERMEFLPPPTGFPRNLTIGGQPAKAGEVMFDPDGTSRSFAKAASTLCFDTSSDSSLSRGIRALRNCWHSMA